MVIRECWESTVIFSRIQIRVTSWWLLPELVTLPAPSPPLFPSLISLMVSVDGKHRERRSCVAGSSRGSLSRCFPSTETIRLIRDGKRGGEGAGSMNSSPKRSDPQRLKRQSATATATLLRRWGPRKCELKQLVYFTNSCFNSCAEQSHEDSVRKAAVEEQLSSKTKRPAVRAQLHLPALDLAWALDYTTDQELPYPFFS